MIVKAMPYCGGENRAWPWLLLALVGWLVLGAEGAAAQRITDNQTWSGKKLLAEEVIVPPGVTLTIKPGTRLQFAAGASLLVEGRLLARGTAKKPIVFAASTEGELWPGITFQNVAEPVELERVLIASASKAVTVVESSVQLVDSEISGGGVGISAAMGARVKLERVKLHGMSTGAVDAEVRSSLQVLGCRFEQIPGYGIQSGQQSQVLVRDNRFSDVKLGIIISGDAPPVEGNELERCDVGIGLAKSGPTTIVRRNKVTSCRIGIWCNQFSAPLVERNLLVDCDEGMQCFQGATPLIRLNRLERNRRGLSCIQMSDAVVQRNEFLHNDSAIYLHLSAYAQIRENNFEANKLHVELDNMSYDWEVRAAHKPKRNRQAQNEALALQGRARAEEIPVVVESEGFVDARENFWGAETTAEMARQEGAANIGAIRDGWDVPLRSYEGWPGEYVQDRVNYAGWRPERIAATGPEAP